MAMGLARLGEETRQVQMVCLDELVPADDRYRRIERVIVWSAVRASATPFYAAGGRPSIDPVVLLKLFLVGAVEGEGSMRGTLRVAERDLSIRRFLGYGLTERLPSHATVSYAQCVRFAHSSVFEQLFVQVLAQCRGAGLLDGTRLVVDATHVEADAALRSLRADLVVVGGDGDGRHEPDDQDGAGGGRARLSVARPRSGVTPKRAASNQTAVSVTDADAKLRYKPGHRPHLVHRAQVATDPKHRVIVAVAAEHATGAESAALPGLIRRARFAGHAVSEVCADQGYASAETYRTLEQLGVTAYIPPQPKMLIHGEAAKAARQRLKAPIGVAATIDRMTHGEGAIAELKLWHGLNRARCRGRTKLQHQLLLAATAVNLKRLLNHAPAATHTASADAETGRTPAPAIAVRLLRAGRHLTHTIRRSTPTTRIKPAHASLTGS